MLSKKVFKKIVFLFFVLSIIPYTNASIIWTIDEGINNFNDNNYNFAKNYFLNYLNNNPNDKNGYYWLGKTYLNLSDTVGDYHSLANQNFKKSFEIFKKEQNIDDISFEYNYSSQLEDYFDMSALYFEAGNIKEAQNYADMMLKINSKSPSAYFIKAKIAYMQNKQQEAKEFLQQAIIFNNDILNTNLAKNLDIVEIPEITKEMYNSFALEAYFMGDIDGAIKYLKKYLEIEKDNYNIMCFLAETYLKNNDIDEAQNIISDILKVDTTNIKAYIIQAKINKIENDSEKQETALLKAYKLNPNNFQVLLALGNFYLEKKDYKNAKSFFETLINIDNLIYEGYFGYLYSSVQLGETTNFLETYRIAAKLNPKSSELLYVMAQYCESEGNFIEAYNYINEAISKEENQNYYLELGKIDYLLGKYSQSVVALKDAQEFSKKAFNNEEIDEYLVKNYIKLQDENCLKNLLFSKSSLDKNRIIYKYNLYNLYKLQGDEQKAQNELSKIKKIKPEKLDDYIDLSEIYLEQNGKNASIKFLESAIKKHKFVQELTLQKKRIDLITKTEQ